MSTSSPLKLSGKDFENDELGSLSIDSGPYSLREGAPDLDSSDSGPYSLREGAQDLDSSDEVPNPVSNDAKPYYSKSPKISLGNKS